MKPALKEKWIEALESGKYKQTREVLHEVDGGYCCLGVLCEVAGIKGKSLAYEPGLVCYAGQSAELSSSLLKKFGLDEEDQRLLIDLNDGVDRRLAEPVNFKTIAEVIRDYL